MLLRSEAYKNLALSDRKFYKMDDLSKLGYIAMEYLYDNKIISRDIDPLKLALLFCNRSSSLDTDLKHQNIIDTLGDIEASPAIFVYTLPNVVLGEICIRHKIKGENNFFIGNSMPEDFMRDYADYILTNYNLAGVLYGWCELLGNNYSLNLNFITRK